MIYDSFPSDYVIKVHDILRHKPIYINEKYNEFAKDAGGIATDSSRFVKRVFQKYVGKKLCIIDKMKVAGKYRKQDGTVVIQACDNPISIYSREYTKFYDNWEPVAVPKKRYIEIYDIQVRQSEYSCYIGVSAYDLITGQKIIYDLCQNTMIDVQFTEISDDTADFYKHLLNDDRSEVEFLVKRYMTFDEMVANKFCRKNCASNKIPWHDERCRVSAIVKAKDIDEVFAKCKSELQWPSLPYEVKRLCHVSPNEGGVAN